MFANCFHHCEDHTGQNIPQFLLMLPSQMQILKYFQIYNMNTFLAAVI